jgi:hypothetical protein
MRCPVLENELNWVLQSGRYFFEKIEGLVSRNIQTIDPNDFLSFCASSNEEGTEIILGKLKALLDIDVHFELEFEDSSGHSKVIRGIPHGDMRSLSAAGRYIANDVGKKIQINESNFKNPLRLVATIAHELCHYKLIDQFNLNNHDEDMTDLLPVFFGLGVFASNSVISFNQWNDVSTQGWSIARTGYLSEEVFSFATALYSIYRGEDSKVVGNYLAPNPKDIFKKTVKYVNDQSLELWKTRKEYSGVFPNINIEVACPNCGWRPSHGSLWVCSCGTKWNTFETHAKCPNCDKQWEETWCPKCEKMQDHNKWYLKTEHLT